MKPIVYEAEIQVRFSDLDVNGHVHAPNYLDYVISGRWTFFKSKFGFGHDELLKRGLGFYVSRVETFFKRPILGGEQFVRLRSWISEAQKIRYVAAYELTSLDGKTIYSNGNFDFVPIDVPTQKPQPMPEWAIGYFFESEI